MRIKALLAVRTGSVRVINKNLRPFAETNLLELKIRQLLRIPELDGIVINSNSEEMLDYGRKYGCETILRDQYYASNTVSMSDVYRNMAENFDGDIIVYANCTNPLIRDKTISDCINQFKIHMKTNDSLNTAHLIKEFMFQDNRPINYDLQNQPRSQDLPDIYALNFAVSVISRESMIQCKNVVGNNPRIYCVDEIEATDIDNQIDFEFAEYVYKNLRQV